MKVHNLQDLFVSDLRYLYHTEKQITKALPKMAKAASSSELQKAFEEHLEQSKRHVERLEQIFNMFDLNVKGKKSKGIEGLIEEGEELINKGNKKVESDVLDAGLIATAQRVEHYEIAAYGTLRTYANLLGHDEAADLLQQTLDEEKKTDQRLTQIATKKINVEAAEG
ncbi:MAG TPA: ferritin-like domain-containing protein [Thermodesulfobacteriota bacterium]|nr:ferritin-like domain-containing protein [Thermodesulfobacteriota bacterium]